MNYNEFVKMISKVWVNSNDIMKLCNCGKNTAIKIRKIIEKEIEKNGNIVPPSMTKYIPTKLLLDYLGINEEYIFKMADLARKEVL